MLTVNESPAFQRAWSLYWTQDEFDLFARHLSAHPFEGDVVPQSGGVRRLRWGRRGSGKSSGVRIIYFTRNDEGEVVLLLIYAKSRTANITCTRPSAI
jgi:mRNA-degrading endonuclease RelE of RelBE toxin-antitoxin system